MHSRVDQLRYHFERCRNPLPWDPLSRAQSANSVRRFDTLSYPILPYPILSYPIYIYIERDMHIYIYIYTPLRNRRRRAPAMAGSSSPTRASGQMQSMEAHIYVYIYIYIERERYTCYIYIYMYVYIYIYIYICRQSAHEYGGAPVRDAPNVRLPQNKCAASVPAEGPAYFASHFEFPLRALQA